MIYFEGTANGFGDQKEMHLSVSTSGAVNIFFEGGSNDLSLSQSGSVSENTWTCATETFTVHETKKIILDSKSLTKITSTGIIDVAANSCLKMYGSIIKGVTDACSVKDSKNGTQREQKKNNQIQGG